ncbi:hypothetical protein DV736_g6147, partial [Chaetothyriales sp. CBS 134916]
MTPTFYVGQRLSYDGALCTVRYHGPLPDLKGDWLGVEWDQRGRGKHNGTHQLERVFDCLSKSSKAASFIRPSREPDRSRTVLEALKFKYGSGTSSNRRIDPGTDSGAEIVHISGKAVEEIGFDKVQKQLSHFEALQIVLLDGLQVTGLTRKDASPEARDRAGQEFAATCPSINEIDLGWNLIEDWQDIADTCKHLAKLQILKASALRLKSLSIDNATAPGAFTKIQELQLNDTLLTPDQILHILVAGGTDGATAFPQLNTLSLSSNALGGFDTTDSCLVFTTITSLILDNNDLTSLAALPSISKHFPSLTSLSLQSNRISDLTMASSELMAFPTITHLALSSNRIPTFLALSSLPALFPNLISLRVSSNPFTATLPASAPADTSFYLTLARIPSLQILNYTPITARDRTEGEIYYLSVAEKAIRPILTTQSLSAATSYASNYYSRYSTLCSKYDRANILDSPPPASSLDANAASSSNHPAGSVASRLELTWTCALPKTLSVYHLKAVVHKHFGLAPLQFKLVYTSTELDPVGETTRKMDNSREEWARWIDGILYLDGAKWKERETEIVDGIRPWGDFLDGGEQIVRIRVEPKDEQWQGKRKQWRNAEKTTTDGG